MLWRGMTLVRKSQGGRWEKGGDQVSSWITLLSHGKIFSHPREGNCKVLGVRYTVKFGHCGNGTTRLGGDKMGWGGGQVNPGWNRVVQMGSEGKVKNGQILNGRLPVSHLHMGKRKPWNAGEKRLLVLTLTRTQGRSF